MATATDAAGAQASSGPATVTLVPFSLISVAAAPVTADGTPVVGGAWGGWQAAPGAEQVTSTNYLKLTNDGDEAQTRVVIDFTESAFAGVEDAEFRIPINKNVAFGWWEDTTPLASAPNEKSFEFLPASVDGSVTVSFTGKGNIIYVGYRIAEFPAVLPKQSYGAAFTVTEL